MNRSKLACTVNQVLPPLPLPEPAPLTPETVPAMPPVRDDELPPRLSAGSGGPILGPTEFAPAPPQLPPDPAPPSIRQQPRIIPSGVLNGEAISLPDPVYPPIAKPVRASGTVNVKVLVDEKGSVVSATAISGPVLLRAAAVSAARGARFSPTQLEGVPVRISGSLSYRFRSSGTARAQRVRRPSKNILSGTYDEAVPPTSGEFAVPGTVSGGEPPSPENAPTSPSQPRIIDGGVLNSNARSLPQPVYPAIGTNGAEGTVSVLVKVDEDGRVFSAFAIGGPVLLRAAAVQAARGAKFRPTVLEGRPVKITGVLLYKFVPPANRR